MRTLVTDSPEAAAEIIRSGGVAAFPTETVYGLGADVFNEDAIRRIFEAKQRPADNPLIIHIGSPEQIDLLASHIPGHARSFIDSFFPGPLTVVLPRSAQVPRIAAAGLDTVGIRMPGNKTAQEFLTACGTPVAAPSANISGRPSPTTWQAVLEDLDGRIDCILRGEPTEVGIESTVVDCTGDVPVLLRPGAVSLGALQGVVPQTLPGGQSDASVPRSPGMRHRHYSPRGKVVIVERGSGVHTADAAFIGISKPAGEYAFEKICETAEEYARSLFEFFRECDRRGIVFIHCQAIEESGIGAALMDRLRRAAE